MSPAVSALLTSADALSPAEKRELADALLSELEESEGVPADFKLSPEMWEEINRRSADLDAGRTTTVSWEEVKAKLDAQRAARG